MHAKERLELLGMLRQVVTRLEQGLIVEPSVGPVCEICGHALSCSHCAGSKGGRRQSQLYSKKQKSEWGKTGGRGRKKERIVDSITGAAVPLTTKPSALPPVIPSSHESVIDSAKFYRPAEVAPLLGVSLNTLRHWRTTKRGPEFYKFEGFVRCSGKDLVNWLSRSRHSALTAEFDPDVPGAPAGVDNAGPNSVIAERH